MLLSLVTAPAVPAVTLADAKAHLRVEHTIEDALIEALILAAIAEIQDSKLRAALITQTYDYSLPVFPMSYRIYIPRPPLQTVTHIKYFDHLENTEQTLDASEYSVLLGREQGYVALNYGKAWPSTYRRDDALTIRFVAGYGAAATDIPANIRAAILIRVGELYTNRGDAKWDGEASPTINRLLAPSLRMHLV